MNTMILYEDQDILVIHKPAGIATETARLGQADVVSELKNYRHRNGQDTYLGVIHRLDQPVEGLLVFAKNPQAAKKLSLDIQQGTLKKYYHALVPNVVSEGGELEDYLMKDAKTNLSKVVSKGTQGAKVAKLVWKSVSKQMHGDMTYELVEIELFTGRHHQIRVQMSHAGMPLLGDNKYGNAQSKEITTKLRIRQTALLASRLEFTHPMTKEKMSFSVPYPSSWKIDTE